MHEATNQSFVHLVDSGITTARFPSHEVKQFPVGGFGHLLSQLLFTRDNAWWKSTLCDMHASM